MNMFEIEAATIEARVSVDGNALLERTYEEGLFRVAKFVARNGGSIDDARDIFHDALVILFDQLGRGKKVESEVHYLVGISKHLWYKKIGEDSKSSEFIDDAHCATNIDESAVLNFLSNAGKRCLDLLVSFYYENLSVRSIASKFGFASEHSTSVQKYKCIEKLRDIVKEKHVRYEDFVE